MKIDDAGLEIIKKFEGFREAPYRCQAGVPTIGYGTTHYDNGLAVSMRDANITRETAEQYLRHQVNTHYADKVNHYVGIAISQEQFDALTSFAYNEGTHALKTSHLLKYVNRREFTKAANEFQKWIYVNGAVSTGLVRRRQAERELFMTAG